MKRKKHVRRRIDSDDECEDKISTQDFRSDGSSSGSPVCWIPKEQLHQVDLNGQSTISCVPSTVECANSSNRLIGTKGKALKKSVKETDQSLKNLNERDTYSTITTSTFYTKPTSDFVFEKVLNVSKETTPHDKHPVNAAVNTEAKTSLKDPLSVDDLSDDSNDCESFQPTHVSIWENDDDVIVLSSDEETFSVPNFKVELSDGSNQSSSSDVSKDSSARNDMKDPCSSSSGRDSPFFPQLSQNFLEEIAAEEREEANSSNKTNLNPDVRLESLVASGRFKSTERTTLPTIPKFIPLHQAGRRKGSLTTGGESAKSLQIRRPDQQSDDLAFQSTNRQLFNPPQRIAKTIPMRSHKNHRKSSKSVQSMRNELAKKQDIQSYVRSVNQANTKKPGIVYPPDSLSSTSSLRKPKTTPTTRTVSPTPKAVKSLAEIPVKVLYFNISLIFDPCFQ